MKKNVYHLISLFVVLSMVLAACGNVANVICPKQGDGKTFECSADTGSWFLSDNEESKGAFRAEPGTQGIWVDPLIKDNSYSKKYYSDGVINIQMTPVLFKTERYVTNCPDKAYGNFCKNPLHTINVVFTNNGVRQQKEIAVDLTGSILFVTEVQADQRASQKIQSLWIVLVGKPGPDAASTTNTFMESFWNSFRRQGRSLDLGEYDLLAHGGDGETKTKLAEAMKDRFFKGDDANATNAFEYQSLMKFGSFGIKEVYMGNEPAFDGLDAITQGSQDSGSPSAIATQDAIKLHDATQQGEQLKAACPFPAGSPELSACILAYNKANGVNVTLPSVNLPTVTPTPAP
jgi:hypothetical protein